MQEVLAEWRSSPGRDARFVGKTQEAPIAMAIGATEDAATEGAARSGGTDSIRQNLLTLGERPLSEAEDRARDYEALDLARAFVDLGDLRIPVVALDRELLGVAVPTENLD